MNTYVRFPQALLVIGFIVAASRGHCQPLHYVLKGQRFMQASPATPAPDAVAPFSFNAGTTTANAVLALPDGRTFTLSTPTDDGTYEFEQTFGAKANLDAAFPNGTYRITGAGLPPLTLSLPADAYPVVPQITSMSNGAWNNGGVLVINPALPLALTFNTFTTYATGGVAGHMEARLRGLTDSVELTAEVASVPLFGNPAQSTPLTTVTIPAGTMTSGRLYSISLEYHTVTTLDTTTVPNGIVLALYDSETDLIVAAQAANTTTQPAPVITVQPADRTAPAGGSVTFNVSATSVAFVRWYFNGLELDFGPNSSKYALATNTPSLTINNLTAADAGTYRVRILTSGGLATSVPATLTISGGTPGPAITRQPLSQTVAQGSSVVFSVASSVPGATYQWRLNGNNLPPGVTGATGPTLVLQNVTAAQAGSYTAIVSAGGGSTLSAAGTLSVLPAATNPGRLINLSILTPLAAGESMTMGTVLGGGGTSGAKPLLARAAGPSLAQLNVTGFLPDPTMALVSTSTNPQVTVATNNDWAGTPALSAAFSSVGAFPYINATSRDAAIFQPALAPGDYTVRVSDAGSGSGTVIAEIYDATPNGSFTAATPRLINVSVLKQIGTGGSLTVGFVIGGTTAKTVLIRAVGPTLGLAPFNVGGAMADPQLTLINTSVSPQVTVATNNDWGGDAGLTATANRVGAFAVSNGASRDAMLLITLPPGNYTAQVGPASGTAGGTAIVEVYEVP